MKTGPKIIISGGGTGGHVFPAIAIANALREKDAGISILFVGASHKMEMDVVPAAGYSIKGLPVTGFQRKFSLKNLLFIFNLLASMIKARKILDDFSPDVVVGVGGYASGPVVRVAAARGIPVLLQEQNSYAGITNRMLAGKAARICVAYDGMERYFPPEKIVVTGNPVRQDLEEISGKREKALAWFKIREGKKVILAIGGSLGAASINSAIMQNIRRIPDSGIEFIWQTGRSGYTEAVNCARKTGSDGLHIYEFISEMDLAYAAADLVISRAGAGTISELCVTEKPAILVPSPNVAEDHQTKNAMALVEKGAAVLIRDEDSSAKLIDKAIELVGNDMRLRELSGNISSMAYKGSAGEIASEVLNLLKREQFES